MSFVSKNACEALADARAGADGVRDKFRAGRGLPWAEQPGAYYSSYLSAAEPCAPSWRSMATRSSQSRPTHPNRPTT